MVNPFAIGSTHPTRLLQGDTANLTSGDLVRTISYDFDDTSQLLSASDPDSAYAYAYDALGRVTRRMV